MKYKIKIWHDSHIENPFEDWDGVIPCIANWDNETHNFSKGEIMEYLFDKKLTRGVLKLWGVMAFNKFNCWVDENEYETQYEEGDWQYIPYHERIDVLEEIITQYIKDRGVKGYVEVCSLFRIDHYYKVSRGYSQGDYAEVIFIPTDDWRKKTGVEGDITEKTYKSQLKSFEAWAWGDIYGFSIVDEEDDVVDSCGGFYGDDHEESGLAGHIDFEKYGLDKSCLEGIEVEY